MNLIVENRTINTNPKYILEKLRAETHRNLFAKIKVVGDNVFTNCPIHKGGQEKKPSFSVFAKTDDPKVEFGKCHCLACGYTASLPKMVADCFHADISFGNKWLVQNYGGSLVEQTSYLQEIKLEKPAVKYLPESILEQYEYYHPYMWKRKLTREIVDKFHIGYDQVSDMITFPVWDEHGRLRFLTKRSVEGKRFLIDKAVDKPVYLLNFIKESNIHDVMVTESKINCLYLWSLGYPAVALFGTGTPYQYEILKRSGIRHYTLCFDGDEAGDKGTARFIKAMPKDILISIKKLPRGKDCNDLTKEEFDALEVV